jgi:hypothetical protein
MKCKIVLFLLFFDAVHEWLVIGRAAYYVHGL